MKQIKSRNKKTKIRGALYACILAATIASTQAAYTPPGRATVLNTLTPAHPRIIVTPAKMTEIQQSIANDPVAAAVSVKVLQRADWIITQAPLGYELVGGRMTNDDKILGWVESLGLAYRLTGDAKYANRAWQELESASNFPDWNPPSYLDPAALALAFGYGYDWFYSYWTPAQRTIIAKAIVEKGINPLLPLYYLGGKNILTNGSNISQQVGGSLSMAALAIAERSDYRAVAAEMLEQGLKAADGPLLVYAPDGAGSEGTGYWNFGTRVSCQLINSLETALGSDFGLSTLPGLSQTGDYELYYSGAGHLAFNYGDCKVEPLGHPQHFFLATKYNKPQYSWFRYDGLLSGLFDGDEYDLIWFNASGKNFDVGTLPLDREFTKWKGISSRDSWKDDSGFNVTMEGGELNGGHVHEDQGSFILEYNGVRWVQDILRDQLTYNTPRGVRRDDLYRWRAEGHNTLVINPVNGNAQNAASSFTSRTFNATSANAVLDLSNTYSDGKVTKAIRTFNLQRGKSFTVTDSITCSAPSDVWSFFHVEDKLGLTKTAAETVDITLSTDKRQATLKRNGKKFYVRLKSPAGAVLESKIAAPLPTSPVVSQQKNNSDLRKLAVHLLNVVNTEIKVEFSPMKDPSNPDLDIPVKATQFDAESNPGDDTIVKLSGDKIDFLKSGSWIKFTDYNFGGGVDAFEVRASSNSAAGGDIEVRQDSPTGPLIATAHVDNTGSWQTYQNIPGVVNQSTTGLRTIYVKFVGPSGNLMNLMSFRFTAK